MDYLHLIAEARIREALESGEFDGLQCQGKPLQIEDLQGVPQELRGAYSVLKGAGYLPEEMELKRDIHDLRELLAACHDEHEQAGLEREMRAKVLRYNLLMERRGAGQGQRDYHDSVMRRFDA